MIHDFDVLLSIITFLYSNLESSFDTLWLSGCSAISMLVRGVCVCLFGRDMVNTLEKDSDNYLFKWLLLSIRNVREK